LVFPPIYTPKHANPLRDADSALHPALDKFLLDQPASKRVQMSRRRSERQRGTEERNVETTLLPENSPYSHSIVSAHDDRLILKAIYIRSTQIPSKIPSKIWAFDFIGEFLPTLATHLLPTIAIQSAVLHRRLKREGNQKYRQHPPKTAKLSEYCRKPRPIISHQTTEKGRYDQHAEPRAETAR
jgi:hypothetical protein